MHWVVLDVRLFETHGGQTRLTSGAVVLEYKTGIRNSSTALKGKARTATDDASLNGGEIGLAGLC